jgi:hypothetical protein
MNTIFKYVTKDGRELGYHLSTFCQVGSREEAKRYLCSTPEEIESQRQTILKNAEYVLDATNTTSLSAMTHANTRKQHFPGLTFKDIDLIAEEIEVTKNN